MKNDVVLVLSTAVFSLSVVVVSAGCGRKEGAAVDRATQSAEPPVTGPATTAPPVATTGAGEGPLQAKAAEPESTTPPAKTGSGRSFRKTRIVHGQHAPE